MGVSFPIIFFLKFFSLQILLGWLIFAFCVCIFGSFQQNRINIYIKSYEDRRFFGVFRRCGCIFYVFFCGISYWFTVFFVDFVVLICIYTKLRAQVRFYAVCVVYVMYVYMYCNRACRCTCMYILYKYITFNI